MRETNLIALVDDHGIRYLKTDDGLVVKFRGSIFVYKESVATLADLANIENPEVGDVYHVNDTDAEYYYSDSFTWEYFGVIVDISGKRDISGFSNNPPTWTDPTSFISDDPETANKHRILAGVYAVDEDGNQITIPFSMAGGARVDGEPEGSPTDPNGTPLGIPTFVVYNRGNQVLCCKATDAKHAVPLGQLQEFLAGKLDKAAATSANARKLYGTNNAGGTYMWKVLRSVAEMQSTDGGIMGRADGGHFVVPTPTAAEDIANKGYVDNAVAGAGGPAWHTLSINNFQINNPTGYGMYTFMYKSGDYYCTSSIIVGPTTGAISATGTTDSNGGCVHATFTLDPDDMTVNTIEITPPSGFEFVGYFK